ncbi:DNA replication/repair protein RecF [Bacillus horti]|uniref:DNA replication and repair protein RecF n=1 Tax=Caldalkalibacillus horti TaxID=77523 RepID=A0ABT9W2N8_9BACI|nr:DNA replication/repair protein RecF [Bacillus horti]MDQ0167100.1 DNA replication and repair protein RecF [Bacillus horti]
MYVKKLALKQYRNYEQLELSFDANVHLFIGDNAQGKTNILEALYVLAFAKSHRTSKDREWITWDQDFAKIEGVIEKKYGPVHLELLISAKGKKAKVNHLEQRKLSEYVGVLNVVMFAPEDLEIVKGSPQIRRRFLDMELGQISPSYLHALAQYHKLLSQRNALLKQWEKRKENRPVIEVFTEQMLAYAAKILLKRTGFIKNLQEWSSAIHQSITSGKEQLELRYVYSTPMDEGMKEQEIIEVLRQKFDKIREQEESRGTTLFGPHRDDLQFFINGMNVQTFGSQGQQRTTALSTKLAEIELIHSEIGEYPILLLDDVLSELDDHRRSHLLETIQGKIQTFVTNTSLEGLDQQIVNEATIYKVQQGKISPMKEG